MSNPNVSTLLDRQLALGRADATAFFADDGDRWSVGRLAAAVNRVASRFVDAGLRREERVLLVLDDTPAFPAAFLGAMRIGAVPIPANFFLRPEDLGYLLDDSYARWIVVEAELLPKLAPMLAARPLVRVLVANGRDAHGDSFDDWLGDGDAEVEPAPTHPDDMAFWLYSSGSTGRPKGVVHVHASVWWAAERYAGEILRSGPSDVHFSTTKLFHAYGLGNNLTFPLWSGAAAVFQAGRPAPDRALEKVRTYRPTLFFSVPTLYARLLREPTLGETDFSCVRSGISAAEALPAELWRRFREATGVEILDGVGSTELLHIYCSNRAGDVRPGTSGRPVPGYEIELRDEGGQRLPLGSSGELHVKGGSALAAYWHQRDKTRATLRGEWFATGDRYRSEPDGTFAYEGRVDDMIKVGGLWVSPADVEARLVEHPAVVEAAVVGITVEGLLRIKAYVIASASIEADALRHWCKEGLQPHMAPHLVEVVDDLPRTTTGKVQRFLLR